MLQLNVVKNCNKGPKLIYKDITKNSIYKIKNHEIKENLCHATYPITYQNNYQIFQQSRCPHYVGEACKQIVKVG